MTSQTPKRNRYEFWNRCRRLVDGKVLIDFSAYHLVVTEGLTLRITSHRGTAWSTPWYNASIEMEDFPGVVVLSERDSTHEVADRVIAKALPIIRRYMVLDDLAKE